MRLTILLVLIFAAVRVFGDAVDDIEAMLDAPQEESVGGMMDMMPIPETHSDYPGEVTRVVDPYATNQPNPFFLASLPQKLWWDSQAEARMPVLITEPVGLVRRHQPVSVFHAFPQGTVPESVRVVTPREKEIPSQVRVINPDTCEFEVVFILDILEPNEQKPVFIYYGSKPIDRPCPEPPDLCLKVLERDKGVVVVNDRLQAEFSKKAVQDKYPIWRMVKAHGMEMNLIGTYPTKGYGAGAALNVPPGTLVEVLEKGPVRTTISYGKWGEHYTVSLYGNSPLLNVTGKSMQSWGFFLPGGDTLNDVLCYECVEGLKRMPICYTGGNVLPYTYEHLMEWFREGWFGLLDKREDEGVAWFFDKQKEGTGVSIQTVGYGYWLNVRSPGHTALYMADNADTEPCRKAYIAWKCPPVVSRGRPQPFTEIKPEPPMFGEDFIRMHIAVERFYPREGTNTAAEIVQNAREFGANYLMFSSPWHGKFDYMQPSEGPDGEPGPSLFEELVAECHRRGMGMCHGLGSGCSVKIIRDMVKRGVDAVWLADEWGWRPGGYYPLNEEQRKKFLAGEWDWSHRKFSPEERADFKKRYGVDMPGTPKPDEEKDITELVGDIEPETSGLMEVPEDPNVKKGGFSEFSTQNLSDPVQVAVLEMLTECYNVLMTDLANVARENNSNVFVTATTSPNNLVLGDSRPNCGCKGYHDLETLGDGLTSVVMDLYANDAGWLNTMIKYSRGCQGNRRPLLIIGGYGGWDHAKSVELNMNFQVMMGANGLCYFVLDRLCSPRTGRGARDAFNVFDYTGVGNYVAKSWPMAFVGVLRDREEFLASLRRGETVTPTTGNLYEQAMFQSIRCMGFRKPSNIISAKRLEEELKYPYKLIIVPSNPGISKENVELLRGFVEDGGYLIIQGATIENRKMSEMTGVSSVGEWKSDKIQVSGLKDPLKDWSAELRCKWLPVKADDGADVIAAAGELPIVTVKTCGKGKVYYVAARMFNQPAARGVAPLYNGLVMDAVGYVPVDVEPKVPMFTTVLTDAKTYMICACNPTGEDQHGLTFNLTGFPENLNLLVSMRTGKVYPVSRGKAHDISLYRQSIDYLWLTDKFTKPPATEQKTNSISQSAYPGMSFLSLPPLPEEE